MNCKKCGKPMIKNGHYPDGTQKWYCRSCHSHFNKKVEMPPAIQQDETNPDKQMGLTEEQLRLKFDNRYIIQQRCKNLKPGVFLSNSEFIQFCGIRAGTGYRDIIEHPDFERYRGKAGGTFYWSHPESIRKFKDEGILT